MRNTGITPGLFRHPQMVIEKAPCAGPEGSKTQCTTLFSSYQSSGSPAVNPVGVLCQLFRGKLRTSDRRFQQDAKLLRIRQSPFFWCQFRDERKVGLKGRGPFPFPPFFGKFVTQSDTQIFMPILTKL